jgi:hypothetical protein
MDIPNYYQEWKPTPDQFKAVERENIKRFNKCQEQLKRPQSKKKK